MKNDSICLVCSTELVCKNKTYSTEDLLKLWNVDFSNKVISEHKTQTENTSLYECPNCKLGIFLPTLYGTAEFYAELQSKTEYYEKDKWDFGEAIKDTIGAKKILEIGCGPGNFLIRCKELGLSCFGSEYNDQAARVAKENGIQILSQHELDDQKGEFDAVFSFHVLEHVEDPVSFLELHSSMVKIGGKICISVPNQDGPIKYIDPCIMNMPPHHLTRWKLKTFEILAKKLNLKIIKVAYEPLLLSNHSYYSYFFVNSIIPFENKFCCKLRNFLHINLSKFFNYQILKKGKKHFPYLKGMTFYIVFEKR